VDLGVPRDLVAEHLSVGPRRPRLHLRRRQ
jgi:hypothetical protein